MLRNKKSKKIINLANRTNLKEYIEKLVKWNLNKYVKIELIKGIICVLNIYFLILSPMNIPNTKLISP